MQVLRCNSINFNQKQSSSINSSRVNFKHAVVEDADKMIREGLAMAKRGFELKGEMKNTQITDILHLVFDSLVPFVKKVPILSRYKEKVQKITGAVADAIHHADLHGYTRKDVEIF